MTIESAHSSRHWSINTIFKGIIVLLIIALSTRLVLRSQHKEQTYSLSAELFNSIVSGDLEKINRLLTQKIDLNNRNLSGNNIWDLIALPPRTTNSRQIVPERIEMTPKILQMLLEHGADPNSCCSNGVSLIVATHDQPQVIKLLLAHGAKADARDKYNGNALFNYVDDADTMRLLIDAGADVHAKGHSGETPLTHAARRGSVETLRLLLDKGAHLHDRNNEGATSLLLAAQAGSRRNVEFLIEHGADIHAVDKMNRTALNYAVDNRDSSIGEMFLKKGISYRPAPERDPLLLLTTDEKRLNSLLRCGVNINERHTQTANGIEATGNTALLQAILMHNQPNLDQIPRNIAATPERRAEITSMVRRAGDMKPNFEVIELLLKKGADPNLANHVGWTPLLAATARNNEQLIKLLLTHGAGVHQSLPSGITSLRIAQAYGYTEIEHLLHTPVQKNNR